MSANAVVVATLAKFRERWKGEDTALDLLMNALVEGAVEDSTSYELDNFLESIAAQLEGTFEGADGGE